MVGYKIKIFIFINCLLQIDGSYHWVVTENGKIQPQVENSAFPIIKSHDLLTFLEQEKRLTVLNNIYKKLLELKKSIGVHWAKTESEGDLEKRLYTTDIDCLMGGKPLSLHNLNIEFLDYGYGSRPKMKDGFQQVKPYCTAYYDLDFSMRTFPHLATLNQRNNINSFVSSVSTKDVFDINIDEMLKMNSSDWTAYNIASLYWRTVGNGTNAVECARRALYFSPMKKRYLALLNLGTLLQELHRLGEAAIVLHSAVDHNPEQYLSHLALGNVYAALGDFRRSVACYDNVLSLNPGNIRALQLKHALLCRKKLESGLLETHNSLQIILKDLQRHNIMHEELSFLQNQINWDKDTKAMGVFSKAQPLYLNLKKLLETVEKQAKSMSEEVSKKVPKKRFRNKENEENNQIKMKPILDCNTEECSSFTKKFKNKDKNLEKSNNFGQLASENNENESPMKDKMNSLINLLKSEYEDDDNWVDSNVDDKKVTERHPTIIDLDEDKEDFESHEESYLNEYGACMKDSNDIKKLN